MSSPSAYTTSPGCGITGNPEIYGLGIRMSFYLLWVSLALSRWIPTPDLFLVVLGTHFVLATAVFFGLVITAANTRTLSAAEIYVTIMLISALTCYERIPYCIWRMATAFRKELDSRVYYFHHGLVGRENRAGPNIFVITETSLLGCVVGLQLWFFISGVESENLYDNGTTREGARCVLREQYGFLFTASDLRSAGFRALNIILIVAVVLGSLVISLADRGLIVPRSRRRKRKQRLSHLRLYLFKQLQTLSDLLITPLLIGAIETTLLWNHIPSAHHATTPSQLIPLLLSVTLLLFVLCQLLITLGESIRPNYTTRSPSPSNIIEHISAPTPSCTCGGPGCPGTSTEEKYYAYPMSGGDPALVQPAATYMPAAACCGEARCPRPAPPAPRVVSTSESSSGVRTDRADVGGSTSPGSPPKGSEKKARGDGAGKGGSSGGPRGPRPISGEGGSCEQEGFGRGCRLD